MSDLYCKAVFGDRDEFENTAQEYLKNGSLNDLISAAAYKREFSFLNDIYERLMSKEEEDFLLFDELVYYLAYFKEGEELLENLYEKTQNSKLRLEIISSLTELNREKGIEYIREYINSDDLNKLSIAVFLIDTFNVTELKNDLIKLMNRPMLEELKYQALFTLGKLKYDRILSLLLKGVVTKNDRQLLYIEAIKNYDDDKVRAVLKKEAKKLFQDKLIKLKLAQIIYSYDKEFSNSVFSKFIKSKRLDIQGFTIELLADLKNEKFVPEINDIFKSDKMFNKANSIMYFRKIGYSSKLNDFKEFYFSDEANKNMKNEILKFVAQIDKDEDSLKSFLNKLSDEEKKAVLKNKINYELKKGGHKV